MWGVSGREFGETVELGRKGGKRTDCHGGAETGPKNRAPNPMSHLKL